MSLVLITGSNGFIGNYLIKRAVDAGHEVESLDADYFRDSNWISTLVNELNRIKPNDFINSSFVTSPFSCSLLKSMYGLYRNA